MWKQSLEKFDCQHFIFVDKVPVKNAIQSKFKWRPKQSTKSKRFLENNDKYVFVNGHVKNSEGRALAFLRHQNKPLEMPQF